MTFKLESEVLASLWGRSTSDTEGYSDVLKRSIASSIAADISEAQSCGAYSKVRVLEPKNLSSELEHPVVVAVNRDCSLLIGSFVNNLEIRGITLGGMHYGVVRHLDCVSQPYSVLVAELENIPTIIDNKSLETIIENQFQDIHRMTSDYSAMKSQALSLVKDLWCGSFLLDNISFLEQRRISELMRWLICERLILLGAAFATSEEKDLQSHLKSNKFGLSKYIDEVEQDAERIERGFLIFQSGKRSEHYRHDMVQYIVLKGTKNGIRQQILLATVRGSSFSRTLNFEIPLLGELVKDVMRELKIVQQSHEYRAICKLIEAWPAQDLLRMEKSELKQVVIDFLNTQHIVKPRFFYKKELNRTLLISIVLKHDQVCDDIIESFDRTLNSLVNASWINSTSIKVDERFTLLISRITLADPIEGTISAMHHNFDELLMHSLTSWTEKVKRQLVEVTKKGYEKGCKIELPKLFGPGYKEKIAPNEAVEDIFYSKASLDENLIKIRLQHTEGKALLRIFCPDEAVSLSKAIRALEHCGLEAQSEHMFEWEMPDNRKLYLYIFEAKVSTSIHQDYLEKSGLLVEVLESVLCGRIQDDHYNQLVISAGLGWRQIHILRALSALLKQLGVSQTLASLRRFFLNYPAFSKALIQYFEGRFLSKASTPALLSKHWSEEAGTLFDEVLMEKAWGLVNGVVRTNFYDLDLENVDGRDLVLKVEIQKVDWLLDSPTVSEIFVYGNAFEGVHLRMGYVARGGIRWSDRLDDYRFEILALAKAQRVKNAVTVPSGAKGGFVLHNFWSPSLEVKDAYQRFIRGLLKVIDNRGQKATCSNIAYDDNDPYLVVAADKGTAAFSDLANSIAIVRGFWLQDAFASGGSQGFDHKKLGITARGAWEAAIHHLESLGKNPLTDVLTMVGIGDMSGDVFGNGLIYSSKIKLVAAFNHEHIFLDPDPNIQVSYQERCRLFSMSKSSWMDYRKELISQGGGVYSRKSKRIQVSSKVKEFLELKDELTTPNEVVSHILKAKVDMVWNGGIGTYVKSCTENEKSIADKSNSAVRVNGRDVRASVVVEGGNLGFTPLGRVEAAQNGTNINCDFYDNVAGVDCSDHEVNLKILLRELISENLLNEGDRDIILRKCEPEVVQKVLFNTRRQVVGLSISVKELLKNNHIYPALIKVLEADLNLNVNKENLPAVDVIKQRENKVLYRPETAVLTANCKIWLKKKFQSISPEKILFFGSLIKKEFPDSILDLVGTKIETTLLAQEIASCISANKIIDLLGLSVVLRINALDNLHVGYYLNAAETVLSTIFGMKSDSLINNKFTGEFYLAELEERLANRLSLCELIDKFIVLVDMARLENDQRYREKLTSNWTVLVNLFKPRKVALEYDEYPLDIELWIQLLPLAVVLTNREIEELQQYKEYYSGILKEFPFKDLQRLVSDLKQQWKPEESKAISILENKICRRMIQILTSRLNHILIKDSCQLPDDSGAIKGVIDFTGYTGNPSLASLITISDAFDSIDGDFKRVMNN